MTSTGPHRQEQPEARAEEADISGRLADLRARFAARAVGDVARIEDLARLLDQGNVAAAYELERLSHKLAGSAGSFGFPHLGTRASAVEHEAEKLRMNQRDLSGLHAAVCALKDALSAAEGTYGA